MWKCESGYRDFYKISKKNTACAFNHIEENTRKERKPMPQQTSIKAKDWPPSLHTYINFLGTFKERVIFFYKLVHVVLYVILGRHFGMISQFFGMKIYYYCYLLFKWKTGKNPVLEQWEVCLPKCHNKFSSQNNVWKYRPTTWKGFMSFNLLCSGMWVMSD